MWTVLFVTPTVRLPWPSTVQPFLPPLRHHSATHVPPLFLPKRLPCVGNGLNSDLGVADLLAFLPKNLPPPPKLFIPSPSSLTQHLKEAMGDGVIAKQGTEMVGSNVGAGEDVAAAADAFTFSLCGFLLVVVVWLGNYLAPELLLLNTIFRCQSIDKPDPTKSSKEEL